MSGQSWAIRCFSLTALLATGASAAACEISVRDAAFRSRRDVHRLCVIANADDQSATAITERLQQWLGGPGEDLNLELVRVKADDSDIRWSEYAVPSAPPVLPVVVLVGRNNGIGENFLVDHWEPAPNDDDLETLRNSPVREQLQGELGGRLAIILFAPGLQSNVQDREKMLRESAAKWTTKPLAEVSILHIDATDRRERVLQNFAGLRPQGSDWVGIVFGRGKLISPPLIGDEITPAQLDLLLEQIVQNCSCSKPLQSIGVDLPMSWPVQLDEQVVFASDVSKSENAQTATLLPSLWPETGTDQSAGAAGATIESAPLSTEVKDEPTGLLITSALWSLAALVLVVAAGSLVFLRK